MQPSYMVNEYRNIKYTVGLTRCIVEVKTKFLVGLSQLLASLLPSNSRAVCSILGLGRIRADWPALDHPRAAASSTPLAGRPRRADAGEW